MAEADQYRMLRDKQFQLTQSKVSETAPVFTRRGPPKVNVHTAGRGTHTGLSRYSAAKAEYHTEY